MKLLPIKESLSENERFLKNPLCNDTLQMTIDYYKKVGFRPPWICYYVEENGKLVGSGGFKGGPVNNQVEIAYGVFEQYRKQGLGTEICKQLVKLSINADPAIRITARTLREKNFSTRILKKNRFIYAGIVNDPEDGDVWEWEYKPVDSR